MIRASWRESPTTAWSRELIEMARTGNSHAAIIFDCDSRASVEIAASACVGTGPVPPPNFASERAASGHFHVGYFLQSPVHRGEGARAKPLAFLGRVAEYYRAALQADPGHVGVLSYNPVNGAHTTTYPRFEPYGLGELARPIPKGWRIPKIPTTEVGRNSVYFTALCKLRPQCRRNANSRSPRRSPSDTRASKGSRTHADTSSSSGSLLALGFAIFVYMKHLAAGYKARQA